MTCYASGMATNLTAAEGRCLNCKTQMKPDRDDCPKCGDRVRPADPDALDAFIAQAKARAAVVREAPKSAPAAQPPETERNVVQLTGEQQAALEHIKGWFTCVSKLQPFYLAGPAGTGKTTLAKHLSSLGEDLNIVYGAYTGKAAHVLRKKGVPATTIHSAIYEPRENAEVRAELYKANDWLAQRLSMPLDEQTEEDVKITQDLLQKIADLERALRRPGFELNRASEWAHADLIVLDEVSMVNERMATDILSFGVPVLVLGDPAQLPPVAGEGYFTKREPDVTLTEIHRQALESPVLRLATDIRQGRGWRAVPVNLAEAMLHDQIICWKNETRWNLIERIRKIQGRTAGVPEPGDVVMCLANNKDIGMLNGMTFEVVEVRAGDPDFGEPSMLIRDDDGIARWVTYYPEPFAGLAGERETKEKRAVWKGKAAYLTFAHAVTCHKAQGSEWPSVYVVDQTHQMWRSSDEEKRRWTYTAVSRASERVTIASRLA